MTATQTESIGFARGEMDHIGRLRPVLKPLGIDGDEFIRVLNVKIDVATRANARQEAQKAELKRTTAETDEAFEDVYRTASGFLDAMVGALGKNSPEAQVLLRLRSRIRMPGDATAEAPGGPAPEGPA